MHCADLVLLRLSVGESGQVALCGVQFSCAVYMLLDPKIAQALPAVAVKHVSRHWQMSPVGSKFFQSRTTVLSENRQAQKSSFQMTSFGILEKTKL
jgi:hypothetical protein